MFFFAPGAGATPRSLGGEDSIGASRVRHDASGNARLEVRLWNGTGTTLTVGRVYYIKYTGVDGQNPAIATGVANAVAAENVCVAMEAAASATATWVTVAGYCQAMVEGTSDVAVGDHLLFDASLQAFKLDGTTGLTVMTADSCAVSRAVVQAAGPELANVYVIPAQVKITA